MATAPVKKRFVVSYDNMSQDLKDAFDRKYPHGYLDYMGDIVIEQDGTGFRFIEDYREEAEEWLRTETKR